MATTFEMVDAIVAHLRIKLPALAVAHFSGHAGDYRPDPAAGALLVSYPGSRYGATVNTAMVVQPRRVRFAVTIVLPQLNGHDGAIDILDRVRAALVGFRPPGCKKLVAIKDKFLGQPDGSWRHVIKFSAGAVVVEDAEPSGGPLLTNVNYEEEL